MEVVESAEASEYSKKLSRATLRGQKSNANNGYSNGGTAPYGYKRIAVSKTNGIKIRELLPGQRSHDDEKVIFELGNPQEVIVIKKIFDLREEGLGYRAIANYLNLKNIPCPKRGRWRNKNQKWSSNTIYSILTNPVYTGTRIFNRHPQSHLSGPEKDAWINDDSAWVIKKNAHPAIVSEDFFNKINKSKKQYTRKNRYYYESPFLLTGIIKCKRCNFHFQGQTRKLKSKSSGENYIKQYYEDGGYIGKGNAVCRSYLLRKESLETIVISRITSLIQDNDFIRKVIRLIENKLSDESDNKHYLSEISNQIEQNNKALKNFFELIRNGVNLKEIKEEIYRINKENDSLQKNYNEKKEKTVTANDIEQLRVNISDLIHDFENTFAKSPLHIQKNLIRQFVSEIVVDPENNIVKCYFRKVPWLDTDLIDNKIFGFEEIKIQSIGDIKASRKSVA